MIERLIPVEATQAELYRPSRKARVLAAYMSSRDNGDICVSYSKIWEEVLDYDYPYNPRLDRGTFAVHLCHARVSLRTRGLNPQGGIFNIFQYPFLIFADCQSGETIDLPGLYDFSRMPLGKRYLAPIMAVGRVKDENIVCPSFSRGESAILLRLARHSGDIVRREVLARSLWGPSYSEKSDSGVCEVIHRLRKKLDGVEGVGIITYGGLGYALDLPPVNSTSFSEEGD